MIIIDGVKHNIPVTLLNRKADVLDKFAERTEDGILHRELIGVYINYQLQCGRELDMKAYSKLWEQLIEVKESHMITLPGINGDYTFQAYASGVSDKMFLNYKGQNYFDDLKFNFIASKPHVRGKQL